MPIVNGQFRPDWHESDLRVHYQLAQSHGWLRHFEEGAQQFGFETEELLAIGSRETGFLWKKHPDGAILGYGGHGHGIMQIDDRSHHDFTSSPDWKIPRANILKGAQILAEGKQALTSDTGSDAVSDELVYAAYNAGVAAALRGLRESADPSRFTTGHDYGKDVLARAVVFAKLLAQPWSSQLPIDVNVPKSPLKDEVEYINEYPPEGEVTDPNGGQAKAKGIISLWYGTNRKRTRPRGRGASCEIAYGSERDTKLHLGRCTVFVPESHKIGSMGSSWWRRTLTGKDDRLKLRGIEEFDTANFWRGVRRYFRRIDPEERRALVYIHGFNTTFEASALRAGQIGADLCSKGAMAFFSWPSKGRISRYMADEATIEASEDLIEKFLIDFATRSGAKKVHIIAHSLGNRGLLRAMQRVMRRAEEGSPIKFGQIFLAAPDVDTQLFEKLAHCYPKLSERTTLYVSSKDKALRSSGIVHDAPRVGFTPPVAVISGIDTVEVSNIDLTLLGHGFFGNARDVLSDMHYLLIGDIDPSRRMGLERISLRQQHYWRIRG